MYTTVANQKIVEVNKADTVRHFYGTVNKDCMFHAMQELTYNEFKIYMYMITNQDKFTQALSTKYVADLVGANKRKIQDAVNGLISKGYLVHEENDMENRYVFYEEYDEAERVANQDKDKLKKKSAGE